jgi:hypothetical protein
MLVPLGANGYLVFASCDLDLTCEGPISEPYSTFLFFIFLVCCAKGTLLVLVKNVMCFGNRRVRGCLHLRGWAQAQKHKWYPAWRMKAIGSGIPFQKQNNILELVLRWPSGYSAKHCSKSLLKIDFIPFLSK